MTALTVRFADDEYLRLKLLAQAKGISINHLVDEMETAMLAEFDAKTRFWIRANLGKGRVAEGLALLAKAAAETADKS